MTSTTEDVIKAAASVARDAAEGRLDPADLEQQVLNACRELVGQVVGEGDPLWPLQLEIATSVLACHGIDSATLREWPRYSSVSRTPRLTTSDSATCPATPGRR